MHSVTASPPAQTAARAASRRNRNHQTALQRECPALRKEVDEFFIYQPVGIRHSAATLVKLSGCREKRFSDKSKIDSLRTGPPVGRLVSGRRRSADAGRNQSRAGSLAHFHGGRFGGGGAATGRQFDWLL